MRRRPSKFSSALIVFVTILALGLGFLWVGCSKETVEPVSPSVSQQIEGLYKSGQVQSVMAVQNRHTDRLLAIGGVFGTATGLTEDGRLAIKVFTADEGPRGAVPRSLEGILVVVERTGEFFALQASEGKGGNQGGGQGKGGGDKIDPKKRFDRPVPIGVSTGNEGECSAGTIGCRVKKGSNYYALSNNHIYALENKAPIDSDILQPGRYDTNCGTDPNDVIGTLAEYEPLKFDGSDNTIDAAIALSSTANLSNSTPSNGYGNPSSTTVSVSLGQKVQKYGRTTSLTKGGVVGVNATVNVNYGSSGVARFVDQIIITGSKGPFSKAGDSGSLIVTDNNSWNPVGLLFAGSPDGTTVANPIGAVLSRFSATIE